MLFSMIGFMIFKTLPCSIFWIPISMLVNWLDDKYDLGYLDEILGGDDSEEQNKPVSHLVTE